VLVLLEIKGVRREEGGSNALTFFFYDVGEDVSPYFFNRSTCVSLEAPGKEQNAVEAQQQLIM